MKRVVFVMLVVFSLWACSTGTHRAASYGRVDEVKEFVAKGELEKKDESGGTPLITAAYYQAYGVVQYLLEQGAEVNAQKKTDGATALIYAATYDYPEIAKLLIEYGASVNMRDKKGHTALYYAKEYQYDKMISILEMNGGKL